MFAKKSGNALSDLLITTFKNQVMNSAVARVTLAAVCFLVFQPGTAGAVETTRVLQTQINIINDNNVSRAYDKEFQKSDTSFTTAISVGNNLQLTPADRLIGDGVNLASRLESLTKDKTYDTRIIISEATLLKAKKQYQTRPLGNVSVKGKTEETIVFALIGRQEA